MADDGAGEEEMEGTKEEDEDEGPVLNEVEEEEEAEEEEGKAEEAEAAKPDEPTQQPSVVPSKRKPGEGIGATTTKKAKKRNTNVWTKSTSRKGGKKGGSKAGAKNQQGADSDNLVYINPVAPRLDDGPDLPIRLSKVQKAEKVELSADRLSAGSTKGYRMVKATRGVVQGAWYFEIKLEHLGATGHTRLGWATLKADVQAPVGYDPHGYAYRDVDGSKVHAAWRDPYGEPYGQGDTIGCYINLPDGAALAPKPPEVVGFRGNPYTAETRDEPAKPLPGSEVAFFKNGVYQGPAFRDICAGRYYPAASMYTLPNQPNCTVSFNFGPDFWCPPSSWEQLEQPEPMSAAPFFPADAHDLLLPASTPASATASTATQQNASTPAKQEVESNTNSNSNNNAHTNTNSNTKAGKPPKPKRGASKQQQQPHSPQLGLTVDVAIESCDTLQLATTLSSG